MPYSEGTDGEARTPGGCRTDRGACFQKIIGHALGDYLILIFSDGSMYSIDGPIAVEEQAEFARVDPGCIWNHLYGRPKVEGRLVRGEPTGPRDPDLEWQVYPDLTPDQ